MTENTPHLRFSTPTAETSCPPFKQDVYSLGLIACDMIAKELPTKFEVRDKQVKFFPQYSPAIVELIYSMLKIDPLTRPTIQNVLTDKLIASEV